MEKDTVETKVEIPPPGFVERLLAPIEDRQWAAVLTRDLGKVLLLLAAVQATLALARGPMALVDAALYAALGVLIWITPTRLGALLALLVAAGAAALCLHALLVAAGVPDGRNVLLSMFALWITGRAVQATFAFHRFSRTPPGPTAGDGAADEAGDHQGQGSAG